MGMIHLGKRFHNQTMGDDDDDDDDDDDGDGDGDGDDDFLYYHLLS